MTNIEDQKYLPGRVRSILRKVGLGGSRNVFWSWYKHRNFGDWITPLLFLEVTGQDPIHCSANIRSPAEVYFGVGSICRHIWKDEVAVVWGSGIIDRRDNFARPKRTTAVRGPLTRERFLELGYECPEVFGDPAILLPDFYHPRVQSDGMLGIIPHFQHFEIARSWFSDRNDVRIIDVCRPVTEVVDEILKCGATISSSLHGIIVSNAYGIPSAWCRFPGQLEGDDVKFLDFYYSGGVQRPPQPISVRRDMSYDTLLNAAIEAPRPDLDVLRPGLRQSCPFGEYSASSIHNSAK